MVEKIKADLRSIAYSFVRAFIAVCALTQIGDLQNGRGWQGVLIAAATAGITAALRTAQSILSKENDSSQMLPSV